MPDAVDIAACVAYLYPDPCFKGSATIADFADWASREWLDGRGTKPTQAELEAVWPAVQLAQLPVSDVDRLAEPLRGNGAELGSPRFPLVRALLRTEA